MEGQRFRSEAADSWSALLSRYPDQRLSLRDVEPPGTSPRLPEETGAAAPTPIDSLGERILAKKNELSELEARYATLLPVVEGQEDLAESYREILQERNTAEWILEKVGAFSLGVLASLLSAPLPRTKLKFPDDILRNLLKLLDLGAILPAFRWHVNTGFRAHLASLPGFGTITDDPVLESLTVESGLPSPEGEGLDGRLKSPKDLAGDADLL